MTKQPYDMWDNEIDYVWTVGEEPRTWHATRICPIIRRLPDSRVDQVHLEETFHEMPCKRCVRQ